MPWVFVLIWSTGFVVARYGMPQAPPFSFLSIRYAASILCFLLWVAISGAAWPRGREQWGHLALTGVMMHAGYLGGVWAAVKAGMGAGTIALIVGLQPVLTAIWLSRDASAGTARSTLLPRAEVAVGAAIGRLQWLGLALGFGGLLLVVWRKLGVGELNGWNLSLALLALASITSGTLYQKRHVQACDVRTAGVVQLSGALLVSLPFAMWETETIRWNLEFFGAMGWSVFGLTLGGSSLLYMLIQRGAATKVTSLMFLVPPCTALLAWPLFGETMSPLALAGMALTAIGVALVVR